MSITIINFIFIIISSIKTISYEKNNIQKSIINRFFMAIIFNYFYKPANKLTTLQNKSVIVL